VRDGSSGDMLTGVTVLETLETYYDTVPRAAA
jgi:hypothetical protein